MLRHTSDYDCVDCAGNDIEGYNGGEIRRGVSLLVALWDGL